MSRTLQAVGFELQNAKQDMRGELEDAQGKPGCWKPDLVFWHLIEPTT
jgi:hypothetical protein